MNNNLAIADLRQKYKSCNLLVPTSSEMTLNPFYKLVVMEVSADTSETSGDIFEVGKLKTGDNKWIKLYSPAKPLLMKLASAAGIQFDPDHTYVQRIGKNCYKGKAYGAMRMPDGTGKTHCDEKMIDLDDEEDRFRLEFMDKSIQGITDEKAAGEAAKLFAGEFFDTQNKFGKQVRAFKVADCDREKYIERSVLVNMSLLRKTAAEKAMTGAILRVIRALIGMKGQYTMEELSRPFAVARVTFSPDYNNPAVRREMISQGMSSVGNMFGSAAPAIAPGTASAPAPELAENPLFDPADMDNAAFASDGEIMQDYDDMPMQTPEPVAYARGTQAEPEPPMQAAKSDGLTCSQCGRPITEKIRDFSTRRFGVALCMQCQKEVE